MDVRWYTSAVVKPTAEACMRVQCQLRQTHDQGERRRIHSDIKSLRRELRQRESSAVGNIIRRASVVLSTLTTAADDGPLSALDQHKFDVVVIDECSQVGLCWKTYTENQFISVFIIYFGSHIRTLLYSLSVVVLAMVVLAVLYLGHIKNCYVM